MNHQLNCIKENFEIEQFKILKCVQNIFNTHINNKNIQFTLNLQIDNKINFQDLSLNVYLMINSILIFIKNQHKLIQ